MRRQTRHVRIFNCCQCERLKLERQYNTVFYSKALCWNEWSVTEFRSFCLKYFDWKKCRAQLHIPLRSLTLTICNKHSHVRNDGRITRTKMQSWNLTIESQDCFSTEHFDRLSKSIKFVWKSWPPVWTLRIGQNNRKEKQITRLYFNLCYSTKQSRNCNVDVVVSNKCCTLTTAQ